MQIDGYVQALREDLARVAAVGDESTARAAELLAVALESALGRPPAAAAAASPATAGAERSPHVPPAQARRPLGLRRSLRRAGGTVHGEPPRAPARPGRAGRGERRSFALRLARPRRVPEPPPRFHPPDDLRWPSTASTRPDRSSSTFPCLPGTSTSRPSTARTPSSASE